jgi:hypothetical protein
MGRGRAKAKQTKVARQLKYNSGGTDLERLRAEIIGESDEHDEPADDFDEGEDDLYARYADVADVDEDTGDTDGDSFEGNGRRAR